MNCYRGIGHQWSCRAVKLHKPRSQWLGYDAYDNALAECVIGLFKTEVINQIGPWKSMREVEWETLKWVDWYNNHRLLSPIGYIPPAEAEEAFYTNLNKLDMVA